jgi:hypothetical protein
LFKPRKIIFKVIFYHSSRQQHPFLNSNAYYVTELLGIYQKHTNIENKSSSHLFELENSRGESEERKMLKLMVTRQG